LDVLNPCGLLVSVVDPVYVVVSVTGSVAMVSWDANLRIQAALAS